MQHFPIFSSVQEKTNFTSSGRKEMLKNVPLHSQITFCAEIGLRVKY
jgi:hypothetical protein